MRSKDHASEPLLHHDHDKSISGLRANFITMCMAFSANHACVVSCLAYASAQLGDELGGYGSGVLYICYALTAFFFSKPIVSMVGPKLGLLLGVGGYCVYVGGFLVAVIFRPVAWVVFTIACGIGGIAGGLLWTAQGRYFSKNAILYSVERSITLSSVNSDFAAIFAASYLGLETITKVLATLLFISTPANAPFVIFTVYSAIAVVSVLFVARLHPLNEPGTWDFEFTVIMHNASAAGRLMCSEPRLALLIPFQIAFGFASSFVPFYVFGTVIADSDVLGKTYVGLLSSIIVLTGATTAMPASYISKKFGKSPVMTIGGLGLTLAGFAFLVMSNSTLGTWGAIIPYLIIYGFGRGIWENTNKAVVADLFTDNADKNTSAFACISFTSGLAGAIGYFTFPNAERIVTAYLVTFTSVFAIFCYYISAALHRKATREQSVGFAEA